VKIKLHASILKPYMFYRLLFPNHKKNRQIVLIE